MQFKANDIVKVIHYESKFAGMIGEIRELMGDSAYVEFNDANGETQDGQIHSLSWFEWVYSPNGWKNQSPALNIEAIDYLNQAYEMEQIERDAYTHLQEILSQGCDNEF